MKIILFAHPGFISSQSMPRYASWLSNGMIKRGHDVTIWSPAPKFYDLPVPKLLKKWMGYIDQYVVFPLWVKKQVRKQQDNTLYVLTDHALGPWISLVRNKPHVVHCHDFLAQRSALDKIPENRTSITGKIYQAYIRHGFSKAERFISVSKKTQEDLHDFIIKQPIISEIVYNGLTRDFRPANNIPALRLQLQGETGINLENGYILHIGGNQWYKNRKGVIEIYSVWRKEFKTNLPLLMIGPNSTTTLEKCRSESEFTNDIYFLNSKNDEFVRIAYQCASIFLFPSLAEGFGWPIVEAMASGSLVITTNDSPMTEVAGEAGQYIEKRPVPEEKVREWALNSAHTLENLLYLNDNLKQDILHKGFLNAKRFDSEKAIDRIETIYKSILE